MKFIKRVSSKFITHKNNQNMLTNDEIINAIKRREKERKEIQLKQEIYAKNQRENVTLTENEIIEITNHCNERVNKLIEHLLNSSCGFKDSKILDFYTLDRFYTSHPLVDKLNYIYENKYPYIKLKFYLGVGYDGSETSVIWCKAEEKIKIEYVYIM